MGISYYTCPACDYNFSGCSDDAFWCNCGNHFCSSEHGEQAIDEEDEDISTCVICRGEFVDDPTLMQFLLTKIGLTREEAQDQYLRENFPKDSDD